MRFVINIMAFPCQMYPPMFPVLNNIRINKPLHTPTKRYGRHCIIIKLGWLILPIQLTPNINLYSELYFKWHRWFKSRVYVRFQTRQDASLGLWCRESSVAAVAATAVSSQLRRRCHRQTRRSVSQQRQSDQRWERYLGTSQASNRYGISTFLTRIMEWSIIELWSR